MLPCTVHIGICPEKCMAFEPFFDLLRGMDFDHFGLNWELLYSYMPSDIFFLQGISFFSASTLAI